MIPFDYGDSVPRIKRAALSYVFISGEYGDGTTFPKMTYAEYESSEHMLVKLKHGGLKSCQLYPAEENEDELKELLKAGSESKKTADLKYPVLTMEL